MKKILSLAGLLIGFLMDIAAQPVTAVEMLDMVQCKNSGCVSALLLPHGYEEGAKNETADFSVYEYYSKTSEPYDDNPLVVLPNRVEYSITGKAYITTLIFYTGSGHTADGVIADFATRGFVPVSDTLKNIADNIAMEFVSKQYPDAKLVLTRQSKAKNEQQYTEYCFNLKWLPGNKTTVDK